MHTCAGAAFLFRGLSPAVKELLGERDLSLWAAIIVSFLIPDKTIGAALEGAVGRDKAPDAMRFKEGIVLAAALARVGHTVFPDQALLPKAAF